MVREHHWTPDIINGLYLDDIDHFSLYYWYNDVKEVYEQLKGKPAAGSSEIVKM